MNSSFTISSSHPALEGHFPNNPIVPGVVILDEVITIIKALKPDLTVTNISMVKFLHPLLADQQVKVELTEKSDTSISFNCFCDNSKLVTGQLTLKSRA